MGKLTPAATALRSEIEAAIKADIAQAGMDSFDKGAIVKCFADRGVPKSTLYRWIDAILMSGALADAEQQSIESAVGARRIRTSDPSAEIAVEVSSRLPRLPHPEIVSEVGVAPVAQRLNICIRVAEELMAHARTPEGKIRNSKGLHAASEHLRRCIETMARITDTIMRAEKIERYHQAIIDAVGEERPEVAERILAKISRISSAWISTNV